MKTIIFNNNNFMHTFIAHSKQYINLTKPKVVLLMLFTTVVGMILAPETQINIVVAIYALTGIGLSAAAAAALNHVIDMQLDVNMHRTKNRPLPQGNITPKQAIIFAFILGVIGIIILSLKVNALTAYLTISSVFGYAIFYSIFLKHQTPQNIVIGGISGALPPLLGWSAITNSISYQPLLLTIIIFIWTPPHFWALAIARQQEYAKANVPMLTVTHGIEYTKLNVFLYSILLVIVSILPTICNMLSYFYLIGICIINAFFMFYSTKLKTCNDKNVINYAGKLFNYSILYLFILFALILLDHYLIF